jgi:putative inorganic carbon (HCO3(-)) transporter
VIYENRNKLLEIGGHLAAVLLPLYFIPYSRQSIEAGKANLFLLITFGMLLVTIVSIYQELGEKNAWQTWRLFAKEKIKKLSADNPLLLPALVYAFIYTIAAVFSIDPSTSWWGVGTKQGTVTVLYIIVFFILLTSAIQSNSQNERLVTSLILGSIPVCIYGWVQFLGFDLFDWDSGSISPVHSTIGYSLYLGAYLAQVIPFTLSRMILNWGNERNLTWVYGIVLLLQVSCLLFTLTRGAWLGLVVGCLVLLWLLAYRWRKRVLVILSALIIVVGSLLFLALNTGWVLPISGNYEWLSNLHVAQARTVSNYERLALWRYTLPIITRRPLLGYGPETFLTAFWSYYPIETNQHLEGIHPWDPHNLILYQLTAAGILGTLSILWLIIRFYRTTLAALRRYMDRNSQIMVSAVISSVSAYLIQAQFNPTGITPLVMFWFVLALGAALARDKPSPLK